MIRNPFFKRVQEIANSAKVKAFQQGSIEWYRKKIGSLTNKPSSQELIQKGNQKTMIIPGNLYFYFYDPKLKDDVKKLPYYDKFPLVVVLKRDRTGFLGLNLHYLPPRMRGIFLGQLYDYRSNSKLNESTRLSLTYDMLKSVAELKMFKPCIKKYLYNHVQTNFARVNSSDWITAVFLPVAKFVRAVNSKVWSDSMLISMGINPRNMGEK